ncbi:MAG: glycogen/starch/alpha-glucan phosphorylase [Deltaproteobacteria bacterium]|nr:glycogen/starch/alpha-glucan phosphorylase [Deltaproteobacteria bacterium]
MWRTPFVEADKEHAQRAFVRHVQASLGRDEISATAWDRYQALCFSVREHLISRWINTQQTYYHTKARRVYYLSMEFLMGRALRNTLLNLGIHDEYEQAMSALGMSLGELEDMGVEPGLGNGGLGRLAACFLDSMATLALPAYGFGLRYDYGIFRQKFVDGRQVEEPDDWTRLPNPWEIPRPETTVRVQFGGRVQVYADDKGRLRHRWLDTQDVLAMAYDTPIPGYGNKTVNTLRLWSARGTEDFDLEDFNVGDYVGAVEHKVLAENITKVLYPNDNVYSGKELRFKQQYFLVAATMADAIRRHLVMYPSLDNLAETSVFQLNDTHPALAIPELLRILIDEHGHDFDQAWEITRKCMAYTNHTLLPEAMEKWSVDLFARLLPRHLQLINDINSRFLALVRKRFPRDDELVRRVSIYEEGGAKRIRMAHLAMAGSFSVNGVAELHTELLRTRVVPDFHRIWPNKFNNKTNGVTQRRWLLACNRPLAKLITDRIGDAWVVNLDHLRDLERFKDDPEFLADIERVKLEAKMRLVSYLKTKCDFDLDPNSLFDIQIKRIHEYKRQLLSALHIIHLYLRLKRDPSSLKTPHTFVFGGKAAPGYAMAKLHIKLINDISARVNNDPQTRDMLRVFFYPNYNVSAAELLFPAADVSEQISTAGFEASGTGNMKFALNGALTLGTLDGANIEIAREVGDENIFIFGHTVEEVARLRRDYDPSAIYRENLDVAEFLDLLSGDYFNPEDRGLYRPIIDALMHKDYYLLLADFASYKKAHTKIDEAYTDRKRWNQMALANIARIGIFSSDRTIGEYADDIWRLKPVPVLVDEA